MWFVTIINLLFFGVLIQAGYPPTPTGLTVLESKFLPGVNISYKKVEVMYSYIRILILFQVPTAD
jgi:hypothetical protein